MLANPRISFWEKSLLQDFLKNIHFLYLYAAIAYFLKILLRISINKTFSCVSRVELCCFNVKIHFIWYNIFNNGIVLLSIGDNK